MKGAKRVAFKDPQIISCMFLSPMLRLALSLTRNRVESARESPKSEEFYLD